MVTANLAETMEENTLAPAVPQKEEAAQMAIEVFEKQPTNVLSTEQLAKEAVTKIVTIGKELSQYLFERESEIKSLMIGLLTGQHVLLLGPPGTGKSYLAEEFFKRVLSSTYFQWMLNKTTDPSELLGPFSIKGMENEKFLRITKGKLPEADFSFMDEVFRGNSAILDTLLSLMNERVYYNDGERLPARLKLMVGATNSFPEDEGLDAFYDRFLMRHWVDYIQDGQAQFNMMKYSAAVRAGAINPTTASVTLQEVEAAQDLVNKVKINDGALNALQKVFHELKTKHSINISDRRTNACIHIMQANALLDGRDEIEPDDMEHLPYVLWEKKEDVEIIEGIITKLMDPFKDRVNKLYKQARETLDKTLAMTDNTERANAAIDARTILERTQKTIQENIDKAKASGRKADDFETKRDEVGAMVKELMDKCLFNMNEMMMDSGELPF